MSQKSILTFFKPPASPNAPKRKFVQDSSDSQKLVSKKQCAEKTQDKDSSLVNEEKIAFDRAEENRWKAKIKLQSKKTPALNSNIGVSWFKALEKEFQHPYFMQISSLLAQEKGSVYPPPDMVYTWTHYCDIQNIKAVILGQDPYHNTGQAHGLAFSVPLGIAIPPSLESIYKAIQKDIPDFIHPKHGYLKGWALQGVLLLNASLTVRAHCANSHQKWEWSKLTDAVIQWISTNLRNVVFLLWGDSAKKKAHLINKKNHLVLTAPHPSPLSAHRGFFDCHHFSKANTYLMEHGKTPIDWGDLPTE